MIRKWLPLVFIAIAIVVVPMAAQTVKREPARHLDSMDGMDLFNAYCAVCHGKDLKGEPLGKYFIHGIGHHVGLEVHDASDPSLPLDAGMVITIELGIYIPDENVGIRIEDMVLVTENGSRVLSAGLPREIGDIERAMRK